LEWNAVGAVEAGDAIAQTPQQLRFSLLMLRPVVPSNPVLLPKVVVASPKGVGSHPSATAKPLATTHPFATTKPPATAKSPATTQPSPMFKPPAKPPGQVIDLTPYWQTVEPSAQFVQPFLRRSG
jgi:hypothetical protein